MICPIGQLHGNLLVMCLGQNMVAKQGEDGTQSHSDLVSTGRVPHGAVANRCTRKVPKCLHVFFPRGVGNAAVLFDRPQSQAVAQREGNRFSLVIGVKGLLVLPTIVEQTTPPQVSLVCQRGLIGPLAEVEQRVQFNQKHLGEFLVKLGIAFVQCAEPFIEFQRIIPPSLEQTVQLRIG